MSRFAASAASRSGKTYRRFVRHECTNLLRMARNQGQCIDRTATAGEDVHRSGVQGGDQPVQIVRVLVRRGFVDLVRAYAALHPAGVNK